MLFEEALDKQLGPSRPSTGDGRSIQHLGIGGAKSGALLLAVNSFTILVLKTIRNELPPLVFLTTEFIYGNDTAEALQGFEVALLTGLESLVQIHAKLPTAEPMQRWARIALAANFVQVEPGSGTDWPVDEPQDLAVLEMLVLSLKPAGTYREGVGSMVPFTPSRLSRTPSSAEGFAGPDHPTVSNWEILPDSSVKVPRAGILSYTGQSRFRDRSLICACVTPDTEEPISLLIKARTKVDPDAWVDSFLPSTRNYAVVLHHGHGVVDGILLKELWSGEFMKVGTYHLTRADAYKSFKPKTFGVNWRVL